MADLPDPSMDPDDMLRAYMSPSSVGGSTKRCLICSRELLPFLDAGASQTCTECRQIAGARNSTEEHSRAQKLREAYFAGLDENSPALQRELAASKGRAMTLAQELDASKKKLTNTQRELLWAKRDLEADSKRKHWESQLGALGLAPITKTNVKQLLWAFAAGAVVGIIASNSFRKNWKKA
jgi:hypothetical protein